MLHNGTLAGDKNILQATSRGFSLIEVVVALAISSVLALGTGKMILQAVQESKRVNTRFEAFSATKELRAYLSQAAIRPDDIDFCETKLKIDGYAAATFKANSASEDGVKMRFAMNSGTLQDNATLTNNASPILVTAFRFQDAEVYFTDSVTGITYYNGKLRVSYSQDVDGAGTPKEYAPELIGGVTFGVENATGKIKGCSVLPKVKDETICAAVQDFSLDAGTEDCGVALPTLGTLNNCPAGQQFAGFIQQAVAPRVIPVCRWAKKQCNGTFEAMRGLQHGLGPERATVPADCLSLKQKNAPQAPAAPIVGVKGPNKPLEPPPMVLPPIGLMGDAGQLDCADPADVLAYDKCIQIQTELVNSKSEKVAICPAVPVKCYNTVASPVPVAAVLAPPPPPPPPLPMIPPPVTCECGGTTRNVGEYCGTYYFGSYGFLYGAFESSAVFICSATGELVLLSDTIPGNPILAPAQVVQPAATIDRTGDFRPVNKIGINTYAIP